jgi:hypothetical protein
MDKENKSFHLWRCVKRSYNARSKTDVNDLMIIDNQRMDHSHEPEQERTLQRQKLRQECKKRAFLDVNDLMIIDNQRMDHSHEPDQERTLQRQKLRQECKKRALEEKTERPKKEIITELRKKEKTETDKLLPEEVSSVRQREEEKDWVKENVCKQEEKDNTKT